METLQALSLPILTKDAAPKASLEPLERLEKAVGGIPNLAAVMAHSPALIDGFVTLREIVQRNTAFSQAEREVIFLTNAVANGCGYCQAVHATFARGADVPQDGVDAVRAGKPLGSSRMQALVAFTRAVTKNRAHIAPADLKAFLEAGFEETDVLDVVACIAQSVMANYTGHLTNVEPDEFIKPQYQTAS